MTAFGGSWWAHLLVFTAIIALMFWARFAVRKTGLQQHHGILSIMGVLLVVAAALYPSAVRPSDTAITLPRAGLTISLVAIIGLSMGLIAWATKNGDTPNKAL